MDVRNEETGTYKNEDTDDKCGCVDEQECLDIYLGRSLADIIGCRVERDKTCLALQEDDGGGENVANEHTLADDEDGKPEEGVTHL